MGVELESFNDFDNMLEENKKKKFFIFNWIDDYLFGEKGLLGYLPSYILFRPFLFIRELSKEIKYAWQRVYRGWDDTVPRSVDIWMNHMMPEILARLKGNGCLLDGVIPEGKDGDYSEEQYKQGKEKWDKEIDIMIEGFRAAERLCNIEYDFKDKDRKEEKELMDVYKKGMKSFIDNYFSLWS